MNWTRKLRARERERASEAGDMGAEEEVQKQEAVERPVSSDTTSTPITHAQFLTWKRRKDADASARRAEAARKREEDIRAGIVQMNGRELFKREPWVFDNNLY